MTEVYDKVNDYSHLQIPGDIFKEAVLPKVRFKYGGLTLRYVKHSDKWDMIPTENIPIGIIMGGGQDQVILKDEYDKLYEAYVYNYTKHETDDRQFILDNIKEISDKEV
jgi:hypothetical protein